MAEQVPGESRRESVEHVDYEVNDETDGYLEEVEKGDVNQSDTSDDGGISLSDDNSLVVGNDDFQLPQDAVVLPTTQQSFHQGLAAQVESSAKWMAVWCTYMIKKYGARTFFKG